MSRKTSEEHPQPDGNTIEMLRSILRIEGAHPTVHLGRATYPAEPQRRRERRVQL
jgi:hypothetical protein